MSVFLRWGIFGILAFAGLMYAYNASKSLAARRAANAPAATTVPNAEPASDVSAAPEAAPAPAPAPSARDANDPRLCEAELVVAQHALTARADGVPLDRLLRIQEIAFQEPVRRARLEKVATYWFGFDGPVPSPDALRVGVYSECKRASSAP